MISGSYLLRIELVQTCMQGLQTIEGTKGSYGMSSHYHSLSILIEVVCHLLERSPMPVSPLS